MLQAAAAVATAPPVTRAIEVGPMISLRCSKLGLKPRSTTQAQRAGSFLTYRLLIQRNACTLYGRLRTEQQFFSVKPEHLSMLVVRKVACRSVRATCMSSWQQTRALYPAVLRNGHIYASEFICYMFFVYMDQQLHKPNFKLYAPSGYTTTICLNQCARPGSQSHSLAF